jgi:hypothetical protein
MSRRSAGFLHRQESLTSIMAVVAISGKDDSRAFPHKEMGSDPPLAYSGLIKKFSLPFLFLDFLQLCRNLRPYR